MHVLLAGDFCDKLRVSELISQGDFASLFEDVIPFTEIADYSVINFEFPIVLTEGKPIKKCGPNLKGQKSSIDAIKYAGFNVCTLANNHILDQGEVCCMDTKRLLEESGIKTVGVGKNIYEASEILYLQKDNETLAVLNCCEHEFSIATKSSAGANPINPIQQFYKIQSARERADYVVVIIHGGHEMLQIPSPRMIETYRFFVDSGADAVINHHQHCFSGYEIYNGKPIFYGLGNLLFDHKITRKGIWHEGYMVHISFEKNKYPDYELIPYTQCQDYTGVRIASNKKTYNDTINKINALIANPKELEKVYSEWVLSSERYSKSIFTPYCSHFLLGLYKKGYLPSFITDRKRLQILNGLFCESHFDKIKMSIYK